MAHNAVKALKEHGGPETVMAVLAGSGHVAYGLGIQRQAARWLDGRIVTVVPVNVRGEDGDEVAAVQASYADFVWGLPSGPCPLSIPRGFHESRRRAALKVIFVSEGSAERAGIQVGDVVSPSMARRGGQGVAEPLDGRQALGRRRHPHRAPRRADA